MRWLLLMTLFTGTTWSAHPLSAQVGEEGENRDAAGGNTSDPPQTAVRLNLPFKTAGGTQLWTDCHWRDGYRIQENVLTGHFRLVDASDVRRAWGSRPQCRAVLDRLRPNSDDQPPQQVVILLHGLMRSHHSMKILDEKLRAAGHHNVIRFAYASTRNSIDDHAVALCEVIEGLPTGTKISFVGHSMGNIVVRRTLGKLRQTGDPHGVLPRCEAMVMLGPPNQGAAIARRLAPTGLYALVTGQGGLELGPQWESFVKKLATPHFPFLIIAGDVSDNPIRNPLVDGSSDFVVSLDEAKLAGATSLVTVPVLHSFLMRDEAVIGKTIEFLNSHAGDRRAPAIQ